MKTKLTRRQFVRTQLAAAAGLVTGAPWVRAAAKSASTRRPNLVFVMADQWRRQAMGFTGEDPVHTPHLDRLAAEALVFNQACTTRPICSPNRACLLTGLYGQHHGHYMNGLRPALDPALPTLGTWLREAGYRTSYVGKLHVGGAQEQQGVMADSFRRNWDHWVHAVGHRVFEQPYYIGESAKPVRHDGWAPDFETDQTIAFIREHRHTPFAAVLSWGPPHTSGGKGFDDRWQPGKRKNGGIPYGHGYAAPAEHEAPYRPYDKIPRRPNVRPVPSPGDKAGDPTDHTLPGYFGACTALDAAFGRLVAALRELDLYDDTLLVFTSDHGDMLGSHGRMQKGIYFEESVGVPLLMRLGDQLPVRRVDDLIATIDLAPTVLGLLGAPCGAAIDGRDFSAFARGRAAGTRDAVEISFDVVIADDGEETTADPSRRRRLWRSIRTNRYSYALLDGRTARGQPNQNRRVLYDLATDPYQLQPLFGGKHQAVIDDLHGRLVAHLGQVGDDFLHTGFVE